MHELEIHVAESTPFKKTDPAHVNSGETRNHQPDAPHRKSVEQSSGSGVHAIELGDGISEPLRVEAADVLVNLRPRAESMDLTERNSSASVCNAVTTPVFTGGFQHMGDSRRRGLSGAHRLSEVTGSTA